jgi:hypothetical protein
MPYMKQGVPWLFDELTDKVLGIRGKDGVDYPIAGGGGNSADVTAAVTTAATAASNSATAASAANTSATTASGAAASANTSATNAAASASAAATSATAAAASAAAALASQNFVGSFTWASRPTTGTVGSTALFTDIGIAPGALMTWTGTRWRPVSSVTLLNQNTFITKTDADANWQVVASVTLPADLIYPGAAIRCSDYIISASAAVTGSKDVQWLWGGSVIAAQAFGLERDFRGSMQAQALSANSAQGWYQGGLVVLGGSGAVSFTQATIDHSVAQTLQLRMRFAAALLGANSLTSRGLKICLDP